MCWYRFGVYNYEYDDETGGNIDFGGSIYLGRKIGGIQEYFLLKKIKEK